MGPGDEVVASTRLYGGSVTQFSKSFRKFGWVVRFADFDDLAAVRAAVGPSTKAIFCEALANPGGVVTDLEGVAAIAEDAGVPLIVDNTMATPYLCRPIDHGATLVIHSTTKFLSGNGTAMGGAIVDSGRFDWARNDKFPSLTQPEEAYHGLTLLRDLRRAGLHHARPRGRAARPRPLPVADERLADAAGQRDPVAAHGAALHQRPGPWPRTWRRIRRSTGSPTPGWRSSRYKPLADKYLPKGAGAVFTFGVKGGYEAGRAVVENCEMLSHLANIGDTRSLIIHPRLHHPPPAHAGAAGRGRRRPRGGAPVDRAGNPGRHHRRPRPGARAGPQESGGMI